MSGNYLMAMIGKWRKLLDTRGHAGVFFTDLSKAFECIDYDLLEFEKWRANRGSVGGVGGALAWVTC